MEMTVSGPKTTGNNMSIVCQYVNSMSVCIKPGHYREAKLECSQTSVGTTALTHWNLYEKRCAASLPHAKFCDLLHFIEASHHEHSLAEVKDIFMSVINRHVLYLTYFNVLHCASIFPYSPRAPIPPRTVCILHARLPKQAPLATNFALHDLIYMCGAA